MIYDMSLHLVPRGRTYARDDTHCTRYISHIRTPNAALKLNIICLICGVEFEHEKADDNKNGNLK